MNTTIQALQDYYVKLGGSLTDTYADIADGEAVGNYTTIPDVIEACVQKAGSGGGSALPAVTADDNGSVLSVVNGSWDKADAPSGYAVFTLESNGGGGGYALAAGESEADIVAAFASKKPVYIMLSGGMFQVYYAGGTGVDIFIAANDTFIKDAHSGIWLSYLTVEYSGGTWSVDNQTQISIEPLALTVSYENENLVINNATAEEIYEAYTAHRPVYIDYPLLSSRSYLTIASYTDSEHYTFAFINTALSGTDIQLALSVLENSLTLGINTGVVPTQS